jgi:hypothetical protein
MQTSHFLLDGRHHLFFYNKKGVRKKFPKKVNNTLHSNYIFLKAIQIKVNIDSQWACLILTFLQCSNFLQTTQNSTARSSKWNDPTTAMSSFKTTAAGECAFQFICQFKEDEKWRRRRRRRRLQQCLLSLPMLWGTRLHACMLLGELLLLQSCVISAFLLLTASLVRILKPYSMQGKNRNECLLCQPTSSCTWHGGNVEHQQQHRAQYVL